MLLNNFGTNLLNAGDTAVKKFIKSFKICGCLFSEEKYQKNI